MYIYIYIYIYMGGCQNYGPVLGTHNIRGRIILGTQKGTIILTTTHIYIYIYMCIVGNPGICKSLGFRVSREHGN